MSDFNTRLAVLEKITAIEKSAIQGTELGAFDDGPLELDLSNAQAVEAYTQIADSLEAREEFYSKEAEQLNDIAKNIASVRNRYQTFVKKVMAESGVTELVGQTYRFKLTNVKPRLVVDDENKLSEYTKTETKIVLDKERVKQDLELGVPVEGAHLEQSYSLRKYPIKGLK